jgi:sialate O-acetylesterase
MKRLTRFLLLVLSLQLLRAEPQLASLFTDGLVLQCEQKVRVWGRATPGEKLSVEFAGQTVATLARQDGGWSVELAPLAASGTPGTLTVSSASGRQVVRDVLVGEVWLASGQSNMAAPLSSTPDAAERLRESADNQLRFFIVEKQTAAAPQGRVSGKWEASAPGTAGALSAVAYHFARELRQHRQRPVAIILSAWGGTPIEAWMSLGAFRDSPVLEAPLRRWEEALREQARVKANPALATEYSAALQAWRQEVEPAFNQATKAYNADRAAGKAVGEKPKPSRPEPSNPDPMGIPSPSRRPQTPTVCHNAMIAPLAPFALQGVLWYQGEQNAAAGLEYRALLPRLIADWRKLWGAELPFLYVQLPSFGKDPVPVAEKGWPWLREAQLLARSVPRTAMAVTIDLGDPDNVHPDGKEHVGHRLALLARREVFGEDIVASGPLPVSLQAEGAQFRIRFFTTGAALVAGQAPWRARGVAPLPTDRLVGFFLAGEDRRWEPAEARIEGECVLVTSRHVPRPVAVRYGWANSPACNLYNSAGLPASPFRSDDWPR